MYGYQAFYNRQTLTFYANSLYDAKMRAIAKFKVPRSKESLVSVVLCEANGTAVMTSTASI